MRCRDAPRSGAITGAACGKRRELIVGIGAAPLAKGTYDSFLISGSCHDEASSSKKLAERTEVQIEIFALEAENPLEHFDLL